MAQRHLVRTSTHGCLHGTLRTVVRIHMRAATLAPMAQAPAIPPRKAEAADLSRISRKEGLRSSPCSDDDDDMIVACLCMYVGVAIISRGKQAK